MSIKKFLYIVLGFIALGFGMVGVVIPMLPTFPFLMLAAFCFANSSERLHTWFVSTKIYKENLESYVQGRGMTKKAKRRIMRTVTLIMSVGFVIMMIKGVYLPCIILGIVWIIHALYFTFRVKTIESQDESCEAASNVVYLIKNKSKEF